MAHRSALPPGEGGSMNQTIRRPLVLSALLASVAVALPSANHSWGSYHWSKSGAQVLLSVGNNLSGAWVAVPSDDSVNYLDRAIFDWNTSAVIELTRVAGGTNPKNCRATAGRIEVCNSKYGNNGWLGIASIWASGSHITQATTKVNDTYFNTATYNKPAWRRLVMCQEIAHDFGLAHQDETFNNTNLGSCMDYTNDPDGSIYGQASNEHPNSHDYSQLLTIYNHSHASAGTLSSADTSAAEGDDNDRRTWGRVVHSNADGRLQVFELDLGQGQRIIRHVFWADPERDGQRGGGRDH
jgi:hypothetical protein